MIIDSIMTEEWCEIFIIIYIFMYNVKFINVKYIMLHLNLHFISFSRI